MWTFEMLVMLNTLSFFVSLLLRNYLIRKVAGMENTKNYFWLFYLGFAFFAALIASWLTLPGIVANGHFDHNLLLLLFDTGVAAISVGIHHLFLPNVSKRIIFFLAVLSDTLFTVVSEAYTGIGFSLLGEHVFTSVERILFQVFCTFLQFIILWQFYRWLTRSKLISLLRNAILYPKIAFIIAIIAYLQQYGLTEILEIFNLTNYSIHFTISAVSYCLIFVLSLFLIREYVRDQRLKRSEILLTQQKSYMEHLEAVQQNLRKIHHDYKNVAAGLYSQVEAGDLAAAQDYISREFLQIDQGLELSLQQHNQLLNVEVLELKTLLMAKILQAEKINVRLTIEVMDPIHQVSMEMSDLLKCSGILLDNAIEAATETEEKEVVLVLLKEKDTLTLIVKNTTNRSIDLQRMWEAGYSTKGENRGLGLANLKEILQRYQHIMLETRVQEPWFNQILIFQK